MSRSNEQYEVGDVAVTARKDFEGLLGDGILLWGRGQLKELPRIARGT